jgi:hypothetical protein
LIPLLQESVHGRSFSTCLHYLRKSSVFLALVRTSTSSRVESSRVPSQSGKSHVYARLAWRSRLLGDPSRRGDYSPFREASVEAAGIVMRGPAPEYGILKRRSSLTTRSAPRIHLAAAAPGCLVLDCSQGAARGELPLSKTTQQTNIPPEANCGFAITTGYRADAIGKSSAPVPARVPATIRYSLVTVL